MANKPHLNLVFIGHVDHGKSTLVGRMLFNTKSIDQYLIEKYKKEAEEKGKATFEFAWVMDNLKEERGLTFLLCFLLVLLDQILVNALRIEQHSSYKC